MLSNIRIYTFVILSCCLVCSALCVEEVVAQAPLVQKSSPAETSEQEIDHRLFLLEIFQKYGENGIIKFEGFEHLLSNLGLGGLDGVDEDHDIEAHKNQNNLGFKELHDKLGLHNTNHEHMRHGRSIESSDSSNNPFDDEIIITEHNYAALPSPNEIKKKLGHRCLSPKQLLRTYGVIPSHNSVISPMTFFHMCPAIIYQLDSKECVNNSPLVDEKIENPSLQWFSAFLSVFIISVAGLIGVAIVPLIHKALFAHLINFLVALAIGTLTGDAFLHLIPHALQRHHDEPESSTVLKSSIIFLAAFSFFILEKLIHGTQTAKKPTAQELKIQMKTVTGDEEYTVVKNIDSASERLTDEEANELSKREATAWMIITSDGIHNFTDGLAIGAAFSADFVAGIATSVAVFTHELPHELGDFAVLLKSGVSVKRALLYNVASSVLSMIGVFFGVWIGDIDQASAWIYAGTAGTFIYIALADLVPEINKNQNKSIHSSLVQITGILTGGAIMLVIALYEHKLKSIFFTAF